MFFAQMWKPVSCAKLQANNREHDEYIVSGILANSVSADDVLSMWKSSVQLDLFFFFFDMV